MNIRDKAVDSQGFFWVLQGISNLYRKPYSADIATQQFAAPYNVDALLKAAAALGFDAALHTLKAGKLWQESFPVIVWTTATTSPATSTEGEPASLDADNAARPDCISPALVLQADQTKVLIVRPGDAAPVTIELADFTAGYLSQVTRIAPKSESANDADAEQQARLARRFGFSWFIPELMKYKKHWQEVLLASLVIQIIALATPLFTQAIIDKVVQHHTQSTLIVIAVAMTLFISFTAGLTWLRQYLVLHIGNRVDAVLGSAVVEHLFKLPPLYFQHRPTGVVVSRLHGVESIREFVASAAVTLLLDLPFLLIFVAVMFYYSVLLTLIVLAVLSVIVAMSMLVAPLFQKRLQLQYHLGARNQAFLTEYVIGLETVKSLQLEPQLNSKYSDYLASHLAAGFSTRQLANTYNAGANLMEQIMSLLILVAGAWTVMHDASFSIGMLVAFQMFSSRLSQPMLRLVGLWQQFQQARLSIDRLGDLMNAPVEPYSVIPARDTVRKGEVRIEAVSFKYAEHTSLVYENLALAIPAGQTIALMGPSGCGKSTLAKLLQGFYQPSAGRITIDGKDIRYLSANELRSYFGVVPQETTLFSGTLYDNLLIACPNASFKQIVAACKMAEIHTAIEALPKGYQTEIGERGAGLSGGQKQRIAIARALLKRPAILIFDEATSALDSATVDQFAHTINSLHGKVSMLFIAHSLPKNLQVDAVYTLGAHGAQLQEKPRPRSTQAYPPINMVHP